MVHNDLQHDVEQFYYREAELLDSRRFYEWLDLFAEETNYSVGSRLNMGSGAVENPPPEPQVIYHARDDKHFLILRVKRLDTGFAHVEEPPSFTRRLVGNVQIEDENRNSGTYQVSANILVAQFRDNSSTIFAGRRRDELRKVDGQWRILSRTVVLDYINLPRVISILF
jgi:3-phenylpropionate/cinnamic acid dioxygenase small subunit